MIDTSRDLVILIFDLLTLNSCHTWRVTWSTFPPSLKNLRLPVHELWVITVPIDYHWKCIRGHCACAESREMSVRGQKQLHFWNFRPRFAFSLYNFYWSPTTIKCRLLSSRPMLQPYSGKKILLSPVKMGPKSDGFWRKLGPNRRYCFRDPKKALPGAEPRRLTYFASKSVFTSWR